MPEFSCHDVNIAPLAERLALLKPISRSDMIGKIRCVLADSLLWTVDTHNTISIIFIFAHQANHYLMKAEYGRNHIEKEIGWYNIIPPGTPTPPCAASLHDRYYSFIILGYLQVAATLDELVRTRKLTNTEVAAHILTALAKDEHLFRNSHLVSGRKVADEAYIGRYQKRLHQAKQYPYLDNILDADTIYVSGEPYRSPGWYIAHITADASLYEYLTPNLTGLIHGDLHCGNILVKDKQIFLIDPNGSRALPLEYDYGKILHSVHGQYGSIMASDYMLQREKEGCYILQINAPKDYELAYAQIQMKLTDRQFCRAMYAEAMHFVTMLPHHAQSRIETIALLLRGLQIFGELYDNLAIKHRPPQK
jgi:thiamine kinase-like enzyme